MQHSKFVALALIATALTACTQQYGGRPGTGVMNGGSLNKQDIGTVAGAIGGGVIGSTIGSGKGQTAAIIAGTLLGGAIGNSIGSSLDRADLAAYNDASQRALETAQPGQSLPWRNPESGNYGSITPSNYYQNTEGQYCREYTQTVVVGGKRQQGYGRACRQPDGTWQLVQ